METFVGQLATRTEKKKKLLQGETGNQLASDAVSQLAIVETSQLEIVETLQLAIVETSHNAMPYSHMALFPHHSFCCPLILFLLARGYTERRNIAMQSFSLLMFLATRSYKETRGRKSSWV